MNELNKISNKDFLDELSERMKKGEIKFYGRELMAKSEKGDICASYTLKVDAGYMVNAVIRDLKDVIRLEKLDKEILEERLAEYKKQLETLKTGN